LSGIATFLFLIFVIDSEIVDFIVESFPTSADEYLQIIYIITWIAIILLTTGFAIGISCFVAGIVLILMWRPENNSTDSENTWTNYHKEMKKKHNQN